MTLRPKRATTREWISLHEASELLGISPTTLRRWADSGTLRTFVTPGGHRRFSRDAIAALLPSSGRRPTMERLGETPARMRRVYRRAATGRDAPTGWLGTLSDEQRAAFRGHGITIVTSLLTALDAPDDAARAERLQAATEAAASYGCAAAAADTAAAAAVEIFLRFRRPFLAELSELGRRRGLDTVAATELLDRATDAFDTLLVTTVRALETAGAERRRARRAARRAVPPAAAAVAAEGAAEAPAGVSA